MNRPTLWSGLLIVLCCSACSGDYKLERKGGPFPTTPVLDLPSDVSGGTAGAAGAGAAGAAGAGGEAGSAEPSIAFCDAFAVVGQKCQRCHGEPLKNEAPFPFLKYEDFHQPYGGGEFEVWEAAVGVVGKDVMPYVVLNDPPTSLMPPVEPLTVDEKSTLLGWLEQGALPEGGTDCP